MHIQFDSININNMEMNSGVFTGSNYQANWSTNFKMNNGIGLVVGNGNVIAHNLNIVDDNDIVDTPIKTVSNNYKEAEKKGEET
ncbi:hypothetical protein [Pontibacillus yanchengensis]|uniref:Uncharacterized protein n=1 Tax=Pontibacillus yanchengensis Y32 TaxID=1385514 RepID=A0A0A2TE63_9BACI|nr:hypothetical protein [Pontibacillus yanchengensis]KGP74147.1 hypothetical protein N782_17190 [Pontibacillus yanchengensis Y32]